MGTLQKEKDQAEAALEQKQKEHDQLAHRVSLLKPETLDKDLLEERVRATLDYAHKKDVIVFEEA